MKPVLLHNVYFWFKSDLTAEQKELVFTELKALTEIDYLHSGYCGSPASTPERPVTDHSFSASLHLAFKSFEDHDFYQDGCPAHKRFVDRCKPLWDKVVVYDTAPN